MSSIITFTYWSKWNHRNERTLHTDIWIEGLDVYATWKSVLLSPNRCCDNIDLFKLWPSRSPSCLLLLLSSFHTKFRRVLEVNVVVRQQTRLIELFFVSRTYPKKGGKSRRPVAFMPVTVDNSDRIYDAFSRLLFLHAHRKASALANEIPEES